MGPLSPNTAIHVSYLRTAGVAQKLFHLAVLAFFFSHKYLLLRCLLQLGTRSFVEEQNMKMMEWDCFAEKNFDTDRVWTAGRTPTNIPPLHACKCQTHCVILLVSYGFNIGLVILYTARNGILN